MEANVCACVHGGVQHTVACRVCDGVCIICVCALFLFQLISE